MLDGRPINPINEIGAHERPRSVRSASGSKFEEHVPIEMEDTSGVSPSEFEPVDDLKTNKGAAQLRAANQGKGIQRGKSPLSQDSPILGRNPVFTSSTAADSPPLANEVTRRQHLMSWSSYGSDGDGEEMSATFAKALPSVRSNPARVSEESSGLRLSDATYVVSPLRRDKF